MGLGLMVTLVVALLLFLLVVRVPVAFALLLAGSVGLFLMDGYDVAVSTFTSTMLGAPGKFVLVVVPMFIAMGVLALHAKIAEDAFDIGARLLRRLPGGLALASLAACAAFAAVSGSSVATVVAVGKPAIREMRRHGYAPHVAAGIIGAAGTLGVLIPPSVVLVIYGVLTGTSIGALLIAGIVPGVLSAVIYATFIVVRARRRPDLFGGGEASDGLDEEEAAAADRDLLQRQRALVRRQALSGLFKIGLLFFVVIGGIYSGAFTVIESAAFAAITALVILLLTQWRGGARHLVGRLREAVMESASLSSMVLALLVGAAVFTAFLVSAAVPQTFTRFMLGLELPPHLVVALLLVGFIVLGMFLDPMSIIVLAVPIAYPVVEQLGFDLIWFGILVVKTAEVGMITPPLGINAFVVAGAGNIPVNQAFRGVLWYVPADLATIVLFFVFPAAITWLPNQLAGGTL